jgi:potassium-transporting ATPase potassium-binding subunit
MKATDCIQVIAYFGALLALTPILGLFMARVFEGKRHPLQFLRPLERAVYACAGVDEKREMGWIDYLSALLAFNLLGFLAVLGLQLFQAHLPLNPQSLPAVPFWLALNTATSFMTNTNWQAYSGEATLSPLVQMLGLAVQNFVSAATGMATLLALARGLSRKCADTLGNFWADLVRTTVYILLPLSLVLALILVGQGVVQTFAPNTTVATLEGPEQVIPLGPAASQIAIKQLGTNGGGFFGVNSAHPFENPTPLSNFLEMLAILLIPAAQTCTFGILIGRRRHGWALFAAMLLLVLGGFAVAWWSETSAHPVSGLSAWMEGKETRFGVMNSVLWGTVTSAASNGSVNAMHDSFSPLAGLVPLFNILLGEVAFGGVGAGLYGMILFVILTVFLIGLMVGRTPEYLGKKIEAREVRLAILGILIPSFLVLGGTALALLLPAARASLANAGPHGLSEILYAYASAANNNGSAFAGLNANTPFYNGTLALAMLLGRFGVIVPVLAIAGGLVRKRVAPPNPGAFPTDSAAFVAILTASILVVGALTFFPALMLGPLVEHFLMLAGRTF